MTAVFVNPSLLPSILVTLLGALWCLSVSSIAAPALADSSAATTAAPTSAKPTGASTADYANYRGPIMTYVLGEPASEGKTGGPVSSCPIFLESLAPTDQAKATEALVAAQHAPDQKAFHMVARDPALTIWAYVPDLEKNKTNPNWALKYRLLEDHAFVASKHHESAQYLIEVAKKLCSH